jgi:hypothetical protein
MDNSYRTAIDHLLNLASVAIPVSGVVFLILTDYCQRYE